MTDWLGVDMSKNTANEQQRQALNASVAEYEDAPLTPVAVVYYIQWADRIKIGTSRNLPKRLATLPHDRLLAIEPGGYGTEHARHVEFAAQRIKGEWFQATPRLLAHVDSLLRRYGSPRPAYVRWIMGETP